VLGAISTRSPAIAMTEAMLAATPSTCTVTFAGWERSALAMAMPSNTDPPGELIRTRRFGAVTPRRSAMNWSAVAPYQPPTSSYSMTSASSGAAAFVMRYQDCASMPCAARSLSACSRCRATNEASFAREIDHSSPFRPRLITLQRHSLPYSAPTQRT
jgi:hypothetical protein